MRLRSAEKLPTADSGLDPGFNSTCDQSLRKDEMGPVTGQDLQGKDRPVACMSPGDPWDSGRARGPAPNANFHLYPDAILGRKMGQEPPGEVRNSP